MTDAVTNQETTSTEPAAGTEAQKPHAYAHLATTPEVEEQLEENPGNTEEGVEKPKKPIQPRINELTREKHDALREAAYWRGVAEAKKAPASAESPAPAAPPAKPVKGDFQSYDEYVEALTDWKSDQKVAEALEKVNAKIESTSNRQSAAQQDADRAKNWNERSAITRGVLKDFDEVVGNSTVPIQKHVGDLLVESEHGPAIAYKLAKDPALAERLNGMSERAAAKEIGKLESVFDGFVSSPPAAPAASPPSNTPPAPNATVSRAPKPPSPVPQAASGSKDLAKMPMDEYIATRKAQGARWGRKT